MFACQGRIRPMIPTLLAREAGDKMALTQQMPENILRSKNRLQFGHPNKLGETISIKCDSIHPTVMFERRRLLCLRSDLNVAKIRATRTIPVNAIYTGALQFPSL